MDPESRKLLEESLALARENNLMLRKVRSVQKWAAFWRGLKIVVVVGITVGSIYYVQPYLDKMMETLNSFSGVSQKLNASGSVLELLKKFAD